MAHTAPASTTARTPEPPQTWWASPRLWAVLVAIALAVVNQAAHWQMGSTLTVVVSSLLVYALGQSVVEAAQHQAAGRSSTVSLVAESLDRFLMQLAAIGSPAPTPEASASATSPADAEGSPHG
jgi:hypothetical protein